VRLPLGLTNNPSATDTLPDENEWLLTFSLPARSTKLRTDSRITLVPASSPVAVVATDSTWRRKRVWLREDWWFMRVSA